MIEGVLCQGRFCIFFLCGGEQLPHYLRTEKTNGKQDEEDEDAHTQEPGPAFERRPRRLAAQRWQAREAGRGSLHRQAGRQRLHEDARSRNSGRLPGTTLPELSDRPPTGATARSEQGATRNLTDRGRARTGAPSTPDLLPERRTET